MTATVSIGFYITKSANAQSNMSSAGGNMTKSNMTNTTSGATKNMTWARNGRGTGGLLVEQKNMTGKFNIIVEFLYFRCRLFYKTS